MPEADMTTAPETICEVDGHNEDTYGGEHYWHCGQPGSIVVDGTLMCDDHAGEQGYGPKQEEYGFDPDDGLTPAPVPARDLSYGLEDLAALIAWFVGVWHDLGYENPPTPECKSIPSLGERSTEAIKGGHDAIEAVDRLSRQLHALRSQLVSELRADEDIRKARSKEAGGQS